VTLKGDLSSVQGIKRALRELPISVAHNVAQRGAPELTLATRESFSAARSVYGEPRPAGADGRPLTLVRTGAVSKALKFVANGTIMRCVLGPKYARYLVGKYGVLPNGPMPVSWSQRLGQIVREERVPA
jgi:hypothetical protein